MKPRLPLLAAISVAPRRTMRWMLDHPARRWSFAVVAAAIASMLLSDFSARELGKAVDALGIPNAVTVALLVIINVVVASVVVFFAFSGAAVAAGRILGGNGTFGAVRTAVAWGLAPHVWALLYRLPVVLFWPHLAEPRKPGVQVSAGEFVFTPFDLSAGALLFGALELAVTVWYLVVGSRALAEAQGISSWRGFANLLLAVVLPFLAIAVIAAAFFLANTTT